ncbi:MAG: hypothetical protein J6B71_06890 [Clostridia bacterium]|nr:hypothetical protein [Clostridia bacterium]
MEIEELQAKLNTRGELEAALESAQVRYTELLTRSLREKEQLEYERGDVEALEGNSLKSIFYSVIGKKEERLEQEEYERDEAQRKYEATLAELSEVDREIKRIEKELRALKKAEQDYRRLVKEQSERLDAIEPLLSDADSVSLKSLRKSMEACRQRQETYIKALDEGRTLIRYGENVIESLLSAKDDRMMDRDLAAYAEIDEAAERFQVFRRQLERFQKTLSSETPIEVDFQVSPMPFANDAERLLMAMMDMNVMTVYPYNKMTKLLIQINATVGNVAEQLESAKQAQTRLELRFCSLLEKYQA